MWFQVSGKCCVNQALDRFKERAQYSIAVSCDGIGGVLCSYHSSKIEPTKLRISARGFLPIAVATFAWHFFAYAQNEPKPWEEPAEDFTATCFDKSSGTLVGPAKIQTFVLTSPDGSYRAYAENEAVTHRVTDTHGEEYVECQNTSRLFVAGPKSQNFRQVLILTPSPELLGNSIDLVDWSPSGHKLLIEQGLWQYGGDLAGSGIQLYDADSDKLSSNSFVEETFDKHAGKDCVSVFHAAGFSPDGVVIVSAGPYFDIGEDQPRADSCVPKVGLWLVGLADPIVRRLPDTYKIQHYGKRTTAAR
jgi:hypothetical protein